MKDTIRVLQMSDPLSFPHLAQLGPADINRLAGMLAPYCAVLTNGKDHALMVPTEIPQAVADRFRTYRRA